MVDFTGGVGVRPNTTVHEWTDTIVVRQNDVIVSFLTQFSGNEFANPGDPVSIGNGFNVVVSQLGYKNFSEQIAGAGTLSVANGATLDLSAGGFTVTGALLNNGTVNFNADTILTGSIENNLTLVAKDGFTMLNGVGGAFTLASQPGTAADFYMRGGFLTGYTPDTTNGAVAVVDFSNNSRISGFGTIGADFGRGGYPGKGGYLAVNNTQLGTIDANVTDKTLEFRTQLSALNPIHNDGLMTASNGGTLKIGASFGLNSHLVSFLTQGATGVLRAETGSKVVLDGTTVTGGTLQTQGTGLIKFENFDTRLVDVRVAQNAAVDIGQYGFFEGTIVNDGTISAGDFDAKFYIGPKNLTLTGSGTVKLLDNYGESSIRGEAAGVTLTNAAGHTIAGDGVIAGGNLALINDGTIRADQDPYGTPDDKDRLSIDSVAALTNTGLMEAVNGAALNVYFPASGVLSNKDGVIQAVGAGATFNTNTRIDGGVIKGLSGGVANFAYEATLDGRTNAVTLEGASGFGGTTLEGTIVNKGTVTPNSSTFFRVAAEDVVLSGGGTIRLVGGGDNPGVIAPEAGAVLTNLDNTIIGIGGFGGDRNTPASNLSIVNKGLIVADEDSYRTDVADVLSLGGLARLSNEGGTLQAQKAAVLSLAEIGAFANKGGVIQATGEGSRVDLSRLTLDGGTLRGTEKGSFTTSQVTLDGNKNAITTEGAGVLYDTTLTGSIVNKADLSLDARSKVFVGTNVTLTGGGGIDLTYDRLSGGKPAMVGVEGGKSLTLVNKNHTIHGDGVIGPGFKLINSVELGIEGNIRADRPIIPGTNDNHALVIATGNTVDNAGGVVESLKGARLEVNDKLSNSEGGYVLSKGTVVLAGGFSNDGGEQPGVMVAQKGGILSITAAGANNGTIEADGGTLELSQRISGKGWIELTSGGVAQVTTSVDHEVRFEGKGKETLFLRTDGPDGNDRGYNFAVKGMGVGDRIAFASGSAASADAFVFETTKIGGDVKHADMIGEVHLSGAVSRAQFSVVKAGDGTLAIERVESHDGTSRNDTLTAASAGERVVGLGGSDTLISGRGNDRLDGSTGSDTADYRAARGGVSINLAVDKFQNVGGGMGRDWLMAVENLAGSRFKDVLKGNAGANVITGGAGADELHGGAAGGKTADGADTFRFLAVTDSGLGANRDRIVDFGRGDRIDLSAIDPAGRKSFLLDKGGTFVSGEIRQTLDKAAKTLLIEVNTDRDAAPEMSFLLADMTAKLGAGDFIL